MTRKHYVAIAEVIRTKMEAISNPENAELVTPGFVHGAKTAYISIARDFAAVAASDNPRFDTRRFLSACGVN